MVQDKMKCCKVRGLRVIYGKEGFRFYILYGPKIWQNFEIKICLLRGEVDIKLIFKYC